MSNNTEIHRIIGFGKFLNPSVHSSGFYTKLIGQQELGLVTLAFFGGGGVVFPINAVSSMCMRAHRIVNSASCGYNTIKRNFE